MSGKLTSYLSEVIEMKWSDFVKLERDEKYTALEGIILGIVRSCTRGSKKAVQEALDRLDGKVADVIEIEYPKVYYRFVNATGVDNGAATPHQTASLPAPESTPVEEQEEQAADLPSGQLRPALDRMLQEPISSVKAFISVAKYIDETGNTDKGDPSVKGVIAAHLVNSAISHKHSVGYASEVLDQIDGKVAQKVTIGGDMYINRYDEIAPAGAQLVDGVYVLEQPIISNVWGARIDDLHKRGRLRA